ncbi:actin cytoskeleton-regulatory complex protein PAN1-like, partial [Nothobranchius furzeri]
MLLDMTKPKEPGTCPICQKELLLVSKHLKEFHKVENIHERNILNKLAMGRTVIPPGPCPIVNCIPHLLHVEKHVDNHLELTARRKREVKMDLKRKVALQLLRDLRATDPQPPMVSTLDFEGDPAAGQGNTCANPACRTRATYLTNEVYRLQGALADAKRQLQQLQAQQASSSPPEQRRGHGQGRHLSPRPSTSAASRASPTASSSSSSWSSDDEGEERREQGQGQCRRPRASASAHSRASPTASSEERSQEPQAQPPEPQAQLPEPQAQPPEPQAQPSETQAQPPEPQAQPPQPQAQPSEPQRSPQHAKVDTRGTKRTLTYSSGSE